MVVLLGIGKLIFFYIVGLLEWLSEGDVIVSGYFCVDMLDDEWIVVCCVEIGFVY